MPKEKLKRTIKIGTIEVYPCFVAESSGTEIEVSDEVFNRFTQLHNEFFEMQRFIRSELEKKRK